MKITRDWLEKNSPCADGGSWGSFEVGPDGLALADCWEKFSRADWLVWMLWKTGANYLEEARGLAYNAVFKRLTDGRARELGDWARVYASAAIIEGQAFGEANAANMLGYESQARELMAVGYLARMFRPLEAERILHSAQAAIVQLVASKLGVPADEIHRDICREIFQETGLTYSKGVAK